MATVLALVPARGGSKGIPGKNLRMLGGHPMLAYAIAAARQAGLVTRVICSTDSPEIAEVALRYGAEVPFMRPSEFAQDHSTDIEVFRHALEWLDTNDGWRPDLVANVRCTSPLRRAGELDRAIAMLRDRPEATSIRSVCPADHTPYKMWRVGEDGVMHQLLDVPGLFEPFNQPRQKLPPTWWQTGQIDIARRTVMTELGGMSGPVILSFPVERRLAVDIDGEHDFLRAEDLLAAIPDCVRP
ncbi:MAG: cytidylyltransferase domain-containing protein [Actinomycetota bacterium]